MTPDQTTPITDDDRQAHEWCDGVDTHPNVYGDQERAAARAIRAHVPVPPKSLADEIREADWSGLGDKIMAERFADRVEAAEKELAGRKRDYIECQEELIASEEKLKDTRLERDEARAEVDRLNHDHLAGAERLTSERTSKESSPVATLPDPADVPEDTHWLIEFEGERYEARRSPGAFRDHYWSFMRDCGPCSARDDQVTLVARLVPDTRRVIDKAEDLDALPAGSIVVSQYGREWVKARNGQWTLSGGLVTSKVLTDTLGAVTVLYVPEVTA